MAAIRVQKPLPTFERELAFLKQGLRAVGADEVGRGCLAGPVVTAAVVVPDDVVLQSQEMGGLPQNWWTEITDSKLLKSATREKLSRLIWQHCFVQVAWCTPEEIDRYNILHASLRAMRKSLWPFQGLAQAVLVDGHLSPYGEKFGARPGEAQSLGFMRVEPLVKGDQKSIAIAAASIVAKVFRDQWMDELHQIYPGYGFNAHKGYPTVVHRQGLETHGVSPLHRLSFTL